MKIKYQVISASSGKIFGEFYDEKMAEEIAGQFINDSRYLSDLIGIQAIDEDDKADLPQAQENENQCVISNCNGKGIEIHITFVIKGSQP